MLLCSLSDLESGMEVGATVIHPQRPDVELLRPGVRLESGMLRHLARIGVTEVWVQHRATRDLDAAVASNLDAAQSVIFKQLQSDFDAMAGRTISVANVQGYRQAISDLIFELLSNGKYAHLSHRMLDDDKGVFRHSTSVAFLSVLVGLELNAYVVRQRPKLAQQQARDIVPLGIGAMLHDIGKLSIGDDAALHHEVHAALTDPVVLREYQSHTTVGYDLLYDTGLPATARNVVLNHHQRYNGAGWPLPPPGTKSRSGVLEGSGIHIFSRIVAAANVLDNLLTDAEGKHVPTVAALREFAGPRFDGWFDPFVRDLMVRRIPPFPIGSLVKLSDGRPAVVVTPNYHQPCRPVVRLLDKADTDADADTHALNLDETPDISIQQWAGHRVDQYLFELSARTRGAPATLKQPPAA